MRRVFSLPKLARPLITGALIFWIAGLPCIFSCERGLARTDDQRSDVVAASQNPSCPSHKTHDCCVKKQQHSRRTNVLPALNTADSALTFDIDPSTKVESCPMAINANAIAGKVRSSDAALSSNQSLPQFTHLVLQPVAQRKATTLLDREATHLRCCVFLI